MGKKAVKFEFDVDFQEELLRFTVTDKHGPKALALYSDKSFVVLDHAIIAKGLKSFFKKHSKIPSRPLLKEELRNLYKSKDFVNALLPEDKKRITEIVDKLYSANAKDGTEILTKCIRFARYVEVRNIFESVDISDYSQYDALQRKIQKAITLGIDAREELGTFIIGNYENEVDTDTSDLDSHPTPYRQINYSFDAGGPETSNIIVIIGREKRFKTCVLVNLAKSYLKRKKKVIYFDFENGELQLKTRVHQSILGKTKQEIKSGKYRKKLAKIYRKYRRLNTELVIKRVPALQTTTDDLQKILDDLYSEFGYRFDVCILDYAALMAARSGKKDDTERISDVYLDVKNFADYNKFEVLYTANHTTREANIKREKTKFQSTDTAKCIDIARHMDAMWGLNQSDEEKEAGVLRIEVVEQRNGPQDHTSYFWIDMAKQRLASFSQKQIKEYLNQLHGGEGEVKNNKKTHGDI